LGSLGRPSFGFLGFFGLGPGFLAMPAILRGREAIVNPVGQENGWHGKKSLENSVAFLLLFGRTQIRIHDVG
jgi:hypothetical protein